MGMTANEMIKDVTIEDLKQNEHVRGLLETLKKIERFWDCEPNSSDLTDRKITEGGYNDQENN